MTDVVAQRTQFGVDGGISFSAMPVKHLYVSEVSNGTTIGWTLGLTGQYYILDKISICTGIYWLRTGKKETTRNDMVDFNLNYAGRYTHTEFFKINSFHIPLISEFSFKIKHGNLRIGVGPYFRYALSGYMSNFYNKMEYINGDVVETRPKDRPLRLSGDDPLYQLERLDIGGEIQMILIPNNRKLFLKIMGSYGLRNIMPDWTKSKAGPQEKMRNITTSVSIGYFLRKKEPN